MGCAGGESVYVSGHQYEISGTITVIDLHKTRFSTTDVEICAAAAGRLPKSLHLVLRNGPSHDYVPTLCDILNKYLYQHMEGTVGFTAVKKSFGREWLSVNRLRITSPQPPGPFEVAVYRQGITYLTSASV